MSKLYKLKEWYTVDEASKRLSQTLDEEITANDILKLAIEDHIQIYWYTRHVQAIEMEYRRETIRIPKIMRKSGEEPESFEVYDLFSKLGQEIVTNLNGPMKLDLTFNGAVKDHIYAMANNTQSELTSIDGFFVNDDENRIWQIQTAFSYEDIKQMGTREKLEKSSKKSVPITHCEFYYPSVDFPDFEELGFTRNAIEEFENQIGKTTPKYNLHSKEKESLLKIIIGVAVDSYNYDPSAKRSPVAREISEDLARNGIEIDTDTVRKWLKEASELIPQNKKGNDNE